MLSERQPIRPYVLNRGEISLRSRRSMVSIMPIESLRVEVITSEKVLATREKITYEGCDGDAVRGTAVEILEVCDTGEADDGVDERRLLWAAIHIVGVCDLNGPVGPMIAGNKLGTFGGLLAVWGRESFGLRRRAWFAIRLEGYEKRRDDTFLM